MPYRLKRLLEETRAWCALERGRQAQLAKHLGVYPQTFYQWLLEHPTKRPTAEQALELEAFLKDKRKSSG